MCVCMCVCVGGCMCVCVRMFISFGKESDSMKKHINMFCNK